MIITSYEKTYYSEIQGNDYDLKKEFLPAQTERVRTCTCMQTPNGGSPAPRRANAKVATDLPGPQYTVHSASQRVVQLCTDPPDNPTPTEENFSFLVKIQ